jgi:hypothetical protein
MKEHEIIEKESPEAIPIDGPEDTINIGDWYWVTYKDWDKEEHTDLMCVAHVGSNFVKFCYYDEPGRSCTSSVRVRFDEFHESTKFEPNWRDVIKNRIKDDQNQINRKMKLLSDKATDLHLVTSKQALPSPSEELLPSTYVSSPDQYKQALVKAKDETFPQLTEEIEKLSGDLAVQTRNMYLPTQLKMEQLKGQIGVVEDKIFTVELYVGVHEQVRQIKKGKPAPADEPIAVRQMLLYMDEECLFDYKSGGMDFRSLRKFDRWVVKKKNLDRILPEPRGIVAMQVRRHDKDYGPIESFFDAWVQMELSQKNMRSYLLIRNGANVYRIGTAMSFTPRLIPKKGELMSEKAFTKEHRSYNRDRHEDDIEKELITPEHLEYDKHLDEELGRIKKYNRIILILQGLIDRTAIFHPMPRVNLGDSTVMGKWIKPVRDEENALDSGLVTWKEYQSRLNASLRKGKFVYGARAYWLKECKNRRSGYYSKPYSFSKVHAVKRDRSAVKVVFPWGETRWQYDSYKGWVAPYESERRVNLWVPMDRVINVTDYNLGDYKMFLCNRALQGAYLEWAKYLLSAEDYARGYFKRYSVEGVQKKTRNK